MNLNTITYGDISLYPTTLKIQNGGFIVLTEASLDDVSTTTNIEKYPLSHGAIIGDTYLNQRTAKIKGKIIANSENELEEYEKILKLNFSPANSSPLNPLKFTDKDGKSWQTDMQPDKAIIFTQDKEDKYIKSFTASLISSSPYIFSADTFIKEDTNHTQGTALPISFPLNFKYENIEDIECGGTISAPLKIEITTINEFSEEDIIIKNFTTNEGLVLQGVRMDKGDKLVIDSDKKIIKLNDTEITNNITSDSIWPRLITGKNKILLDINREEKVFKIKYIWQERMI